MKYLSTGKNRISTRLVTFAVITTFLYQSLTWASQTDRENLAVRSAFKRAEKYLGNQKDIEFADILTLIGDLTVILTELNTVAGASEQDILKKIGDINTKLNGTRMSLEKKIFSETLSSGKLIRTVLVKLDGTPWRKIYLNPRILDQIDCIGIKKEEDLDWLNTPETENVWIVNIREGLKFSPLGHEIDKNLAQAMMNVAVEVDTIGDRSNPQTIVHYNRLKKETIQAINGAPSDKDVIVLGAGELNDIPDELFTEKKFNTVYLVDINIDLMKKSLAERGFNDLLTTGKVRLVQIDVSLIDQSFKDEVDRIIDASRDIADAAQRLISLYKSRGSSAVIHQIPEELRNINAGLVISSMLLANLPTYFNKVIERRVAQRFKRRLKIDENLFTKANYSEAVFPVIQGVFSGHAWLLQSLAEPDGKIYLSTVIGRFRPNDLARVGLTPERLEKGYKDTAEAFQTGENRMLPRFVLQLFQLFTSSPFQSPVQWHIDTPVLNIPNTIWRREFVIMYTNVWYWLNRPDLGSAQLVQSLIMTPFPCGTEKDKKPTEDDGRTVVDEEPAAEKNPALTVIRSVLDRGGISQSFTKRLSDEELLSVGSAALQERPDELATVLGGLLERYGFFQVDDERLTSIRESLRQELGSIPSLKFSPLGTTSVVGEIRSRQELNVNRFVDALRSDSVQRREKIIILALDTDIGNMQRYATSLLAELSNQYRKGNLENVHFVRSGGGSLQTEIKDKIKEMIKNRAIESENDVDIVLITRKANLDTDNYQEIVNMENAHVTVIDDTNMQEGSYIPILEILTFALKTALDSNFEEIRILYKEITGESLTVSGYNRIKENKIPLTLILKPVTPIDINELREIYEATKNLLISA